MLPGRSGKEGSFSKLFTISPSRICEKAIGRASSEHCKLFSKRKLGHNWFKVKWIMMGIRDGIPGSGEQKEGWLAGSLTAVSWVQGNSLHHHHYYHIHIKIF